MEVQHFTARVSLARKPKRMVRSKVEVCIVRRRSISMGWYAFEYRIGNRPEEHELEEFPAIGDARRYAAQNLALMLEGGDDLAGSVAVGTAVEADVHWLGVYEVERTALPKWRPAIRRA
jgi:hypothetical protein